MKSERIIILCLLAALAALYFLTNPADVSWLPVCPLYRITGLLCPFCGAQRMAHALLHLDFPAAFSYNAFLFIALPYLLFLLLLQCLNPHRLRDLRGRLKSNKAFLAYGIAAIVWMVVRNGFH